MTEELETLRAELARQTERADYGWKNVAVLDRARAQLQAEVDRLRELLKEKTK